METAIDRMVDLVQSKGTMSLSQVAKELRVEETQVEEIANVLADSGMIRIRYTLTGTFIEPKVALLKPRERDKVVAEAKKRAGIRSLLSQVEAEIAQSETMLKPAEDEAVRRMKKMDDLLLEIEKQEREATEEELRTLRSEALGLEKGMKRVGGEMRTVEDQMARLTARIHALETKAPEKAEARKEHGPGLFSRLFGWIFRIFGRKTGG